MSPLIIQLLLSIAILTALDAVWFTTVMNKYFINHLSHLLNIVNGHVTLKWCPALLVYVALALGVVLFVLPSAGVLAVHPTWIRGAVFGAIVYTVYEGTNAAILKKWPASLLVADILWGAFACGLTAHVVAMLSR
jgi:uncharacterized membrane protein